MLLADVLLLPRKEQIRLGAGLTDNGQSMIKKVPSRHFLGAGKSVHLFCWY